MSRRIAIVQGHPDSSAPHFGHLLAEAYAAGAVAGGHEVRQIWVAKLDFPWLQSQTDWESGPLPAGLEESQATLAWAEHYVLVFPLWLGTMPALVKAFLEQVLRPGFAFRRTPGGKGWEKKMRGKSARLVVTMGMPAFWYRWFFCAHGVRVLKRNILGFCGIHPIGESFIGMVEAENGTARKRWLEKLRALGRKGV